MPMTGVNIAINKKQYNSKTISEKTWKEKEENTNNPQTGIKETQSTETETIDLNEEPIEKEEIKAEEEETSGGFWGDLWNGAVSVGTSIADGASAAWDATTDFVEDTGTAIASGFNSAVNVVGDIATGALDTMSGFGSMLFDWGSDRLDDIKEFASSAGDVLLKSTEKINEILQATAATNATIILGLVEGIGEFAEAIVDAVAIIGTGVISVFTGAFDLGQAIGAAITGNEWESVTKQMWDGTMGFVSEQWVSGAFDMLYEDTGFGQWIAENAVGFDTVRGISSGIGYVAGMIALTIATCGAGSAPTVASAISSTATEGAIIAGTAGFGQGAEEAWGNGATLGEGLGYAGVKGIYDGVSYFVGGKMSGVVIGEGVSAGSRLLTSTVRVGFDAFDGGLSGFADPAAKMIYNDKSYSESFEENGGWQTVATNTFIGGGMSAFGEITDNIKIRKTEKNVSSTYNKNASQIDNLDKNIIDGTNTTKKKPLWDYNLQLFASDAASNEIANNIPIESFIDDAIKHMDDKYGSGMGLKRIKRFLSTGNSKYITGDYYIRDIFESIDITTISNIIGYKISLDEIIKSGNYDWAEKVAIKMGNFSKMDTIKQLKDLQNFIDAASSMDDKIYSSYVSDGVRANLDQTRSYLYNRYKEVDNVDMMYWGGKNNDAFLNFKIGAKHNYPLGNSFKIYIPVEQSTATKTTTEIIDYLIKNNIASDNKISKNTRCDALVLRIYDAKDAYNVIDYINSNQNITIGNQGIALARRYGKVSIAMDGYTSYNSVSSSALQSYIKTTNKPTVSGFHSYVKSILYNAQVNGDYKSLDNIFGTEINGILSRKNATKIDAYANIVQVLETLSISIDPNKDVSDLLNNAITNQDYNSYNLLVSNISSSIKD